MLGQMDDSAGGHPGQGAVMHGDASAEAQALRDRIEARSKCAEDVTTTSTPVIGASSDPGLLGIAFYVWG